MHRETNTIRRIPKSVKALILATSGASSELARRAGCSPTLVSLALAGERNCPQRLWDAIVDWQLEHQRGALAEMAAEEMRHAS